MKSTHGKSMTNLGKSIRISAHPLIANILARKFSKSDPRCRRR